MIFFATQMLLGKHERMFFTEGDEARARAFAEENGYPVDWDAKAKSKLLCSSGESAEPAALWCVPIDRSVMRVRELMDLAAPNWEADFQIQTTEWGQVSVSLSRKSLARTFDARELTKVLSRLDWSIGSENLSKAIFP